MKKLYVSISLICGLLFALNNVHAAAVPKPAPTPSSLGDKWSADRDTRVAQSAAIKSEQANIETEAAPMYTEQKHIEEKEKPFLAEKTRIDSGWATYDAGAPGYKARCNSRTFHVPAEQAAYDSCNTEHEQRERTRLDLKKQEDANYANLKPLLDRWMKLETQMEPYMLAWRDLKNKLAAIEKEIQRLNALISKDSECNTLRTKAKDTRVALSQLEREKLHLCESILFDGADPKLLLGDETLAAVDPNLPPLSWKPKRFTITPNQ